MWPRLLVPVAVVAQLAVLAITTSASALPSRDVAGPLAVVVRAVPRPADPLPFVPRPPSLAAEADDAPPESPEPIAPQDDPAAPPEPIEPPEPPPVADVSVDCTPVEETGWRKGRKTPITLVAIENDRVERATANAYLAMRKAAADQGVELTIFSAFRSEEEQRYFYDCFKTCACNSCAPAAKPGFSNHQMGRAIDIAMWPGVHDWLVANAAAFGFAETVRGEPWHWELRGKAKPPASPTCPEPPRTRASKGKRGAKKSR